MKYTEHLYQKQYHHFLSRLSVERNLAERTLKAYACDLRCMGAWFQQTNSSQLNQNTLLQYFEFLQKEQHLNPKSIHRKYVSIHQFCVFLIEESYAQETFFRFTSRKFILPRTLPKTLTTDEVKRLILSADSEYQNLSSDFRRHICSRDNAIIELLFCLGLRISEIHLLNMEDYQSSNHTLLIHGKGRKERLLFISDGTVVNKLNYWIQIRSYFSPKVSSLFVNKFGNPLSIYGIENIFEKYKIKANINSKATPHYLRHTFATCLLNNGATIRDVQELLGHNSIITTQIYTEVSIARKREVLMRFNERNSLFSS